ncbi:MAG: hypothetical protein ABFS56_30160 [Pseudomonadota bacterium]
MDWVNSFGYDSITFLDLDGRAHPLNTTGKDRGKVAYTGSINEARNGKPYVTVTVINQRASVKNESYTGSKDVIDRLWDDYKSSNSMQKKHQKRAVRPQADANKDKTEAAQKKRNVLRDKALFGRLSSDPQGSQAVYLDAKGITGFIPHGKVRYGTDKHGDFAVIPLFNIKGEFVGLQRFYDRNIKGRDTNKDFTWGLVKSGACHILGDIDKDYAEIVYICEGYADGVVVYGLTKAPVFIALDAYNLDAVTQAIKLEYPKAQGVVICDNDAHKYNEGVDNLGVLNGIDAAKKAGYLFVIPDFSSYEQSGKPKDLWDLWQLGGDKAVVDLLDAPQKVPENLDEFKLDFMGLESINQASASLVKRFLRLTNMDKVIESVKTRIEPHLERLGLTWGSFTRTVKTEVHKALPALKNRIARRFESRLLDADTTIDSQLMLSLTTLPWSLIAA